MNYLSSVSAALWNQDIVWPVEQTDALLRLHVQQGTGPLVFPHVLVQEDIPTGVKMQMKSVCLQTMQQHVQLQHTLDIAWSALVSAGIHPVLMKGAGLASLYPEMQQRSWGDIDLFVGIDQYHPACAVMRDTFPNALKFDEELDHYKHYNLIADGISIEIHRVSVGFQHPVDKRRYARIEQYGMSHSETMPIGNLSIQIPEATFNAFFVMLHAWEHATTQGANLRQFCDLMLLLHRYSSQIDQVRLKRWLNELHLMDVWRLYMWVLVNYLGLPQREAPFYDDNVSGRAALLVDDLLAGRLKPKKEEREIASNRVVRKFHTMQERLRNARRIAHYSPAYARHMKAEILLHGAMRFFAKDRHWE